MLLAVYTLLACLFLDPSRNFKARLGDLLPAEILFRSIVALYAISTLFEACRGSSPCVVINFSAYVKGKHKHKHVLRFKASDDSESRQSMRNEESFYS
jgi:hypothetical protein